MPDQNNQPHINPGFGAILTAMRQGGEPNGNISNTSGMFGGISQIPAQGQKQDNRQRPNINPFLQMLLSGLGGQNGL